MAADRITIALEDQSQGYAISPRRVPLSLIAEFSADVRQLVQGSQREIDPASIAVEIMECSLAYSFPLQGAERLLQDLSTVADTSDITAIDRKRRDVLQRWQRAARSIPHRAVRIASAVLSREITIDGTTRYLLPEAEQWVETERYIQGQIVDLGGMQDSNAHVVLPDGMKLIVRTDRDMIKGAKTNLVYQTVRLRIRAEVSLSTGQCATHR